MKIRFFFVISVVSFAFLLASVSVSAQKPGANMTFANGGVVKIQGAEYETTVGQLKGVPIKVIVFSPKNIAMPDGFATFMSPENETITKLVDSCVEFKCSILEVVVNFVTTDKVAYTITNSVTADDQKIRSTRITIQYPKGK